MSARGTAEFSIYWFELPTFHDVARGTSQRM